jgi:nucleotide-binding universal stress UspA family protein
MFQNIVVATDGSDNAKRAAEVGAELASACGARLIIVHVAPTNTSLEDVENFNILPPEVKDEIKRMRESMGGLELSVYAPVPVPQSAIEFLGNAVLDRADNVARDSGMKNISRVLAYGNPAENIVAEAEKAKADLIVIGTRGLSDLSGLVMGSVSHKVIQLAKCPCVTVK